MPSEPVAPTAERPRGSAGRRVLWSLVALAIGALALFELGGAVVGLVAERSFARRSGGLEAREIEELRALHRRVESGRSDPRSLDLRLLRGAFRSLDLGAWAERPTWRALRLGLVLRIPAALLVMGACLGILIGSDRARRPLLLGVLALACLPGIEALAFRSEGAAFASDLERDFRIAHAELYEAVGYRAPFPVLETPDDDGARTLALAWFLFRSGPWQAAALFCGVSLLRRRPPATDEPSEDPR